MHFRLKCRHDARPSGFGASDDHYAGPPEDKLVYAVETDKGQDTLTPAKFSKQYGSKNDPSSVWLLPPDEKAPAHGAEPAKTKSPATRDVCPPTSTTPALPNTQAQRRTSQQMLG